MDREDWSALADLCAEAACQFHIGSPEHEHWWEAANEADREAMFRPGADAELVQRFIEGWLERWHGGG